jgi:transcriptional regulator NrdR family protein
MTADASQQAWRCTIVNDRPNFSPFHFTVSLESSEPSCDYPLVVTFGLSFHQPSDRTRYDMRCPICHAEKVRVIDSYVTLRGFTMRRCRCQSCGRWHLSPEAPIAEQVQNQEMTPQMIQSMEILQLPLVALRERIEQELTENPVLETTQTAEGEDVAWDTICLKLQEVIDAEDKKKPYSDDQLVSELARHGLKVARRTITKCRQQLGIPSSRRRRDEPNL